MFTPKQTVTEAVGARNGASHPRRLREHHVAQVRSVGRGRWQRSLASLAGLATALTGLFVFTPALVAKADVAQRTSWNAAAHQLYRLEGNDGTKWVPIDPSKLVLSVTPAVTSQAVISAFADVESSTTVNTEVGIEWGTTVVAWKDGGEYSGSSPNPVYVQTPMTMTAGINYTFTLVWRAATAQPLGSFLEAGDPVPPYGPGFSPTTLNALLTPNGAGLVQSAPGSGGSQYSTASTSWTLMNSNVEKTFTTPSGSSNFNALVIASADLFSLSSAWASADMGICFAAGSSLSSGCTAGSSIIAAQTSGSATGAMPVAALVEATATLAPNATYTVGIFWESETTGHAIYAGAGVSPYSISSLIVQMAPTSDAELSTAPPTAQQTRSPHTGDDGTAWETIGSASLSLTPAVNVLTYLSANTTLSVSVGNTVPVDYGICVTWGAEACDGAGDYIVAETASRVAGPTPDAAYLQIPVFMTAGRAYTVTLEWRSGTSLTGTESMIAGHNAPLTENTSLTAFQVPYAAPSAPTGVSASAANGQAIVTWSASTSSPGSPLTGYAVTPSVRGIPLQSMLVGNVTSFTVPNLANGQPYSFSVAGVNAVGPGSTASSGTVTPGLPGAPTGVTIGTRGNGFENLSWTAPSSSGASAITGYLITPQIAGVAQTATTLWGSGTSTSITGLTDGTNYTFAVAAINVFGTGSAGTSGSNNPYKKIPGALTGVQGTAGNAQATVTWAPPSDNGGSSITSYTITPYIGGTAQATTSAPSSPATVLGLTNGTTYTFTVAAVNSIGAGAASASSWAVIPAATPVVPTMTLGVDKGTSATYAIGTSVTYTATISSNAGSATTASFTDTLPTGVSGSGGSILVNGAACSGGTTCTATANSVSVSGLTIPATGNVVVTYGLTVTGSLRSCAVEADGASVTITSGNSVGASAPFTACDSDLGSSAWNSLVTQTIGDGGNAAVNPANGNLVVTQTDGIPMQLHGGLTFDLSRTYNSEDTDLAGLPDPVGNGWILNFVDVGTQPGGIALLTPSITSYANKTPATMVDTTGARYVFQPAVLSSVINVGSLSQTGVLGTAIPNNLPKTSGYNQRCIDELFTPPAGLHTSLWRYVETTGTCSTLSSSTNAIIGYVSIGVDRVRREFNASGQLINLQDAYGNEVFYSYTSGQLTAVTESNGNRKFTISYGSTVRVTDPAGEVTTYTLSSGNLSGVANPDGTSLAYTYGACTGASSMQLCSATDGRGNATTFTYSAAPVGPPMVATFSDRDGHTTTMTYNAANVTADRSGERTNYAAIDAAGRVGEIDAGNTSNIWLTQAFYGWDTAASGCRQPDAVLDNDLCFIIRRGVTSGSTTPAPDRVTYYSYGDEGQMLVQRDLDYPTDLYTTAGYQAEYFEAGVTVSTYTDTVAGSGSVTSTNQSGSPRRDTGTLFDVITQTQSLTPVGNAPGAAVVNYTTTYKVDNNAAVTLNTTNASSLCGSSSSPTANTGVICEIDAPYTGATHALTNYTYNSDGSRATMTNPNAQGTGTEYVYTYYQNTDKDLSGTTVAGGWLKAIADPTYVSGTNFDFTVFAYDAEGQQVRSWDRDATTAAGIALSAASWDSVSSPPGGYTEKLYIDGLDTAASTFSAPGRYVLASRTPAGPYPTITGEWTTDTVDQNGNVIGTRGANQTGDDPTSLPICPQSSTGTTYEDTCRTYDPNDNLLTTLTPMEAKGATQKFTTYSYDPFDDQTTVTDPNNNVTATVYDSVNRATNKYWTMAAWGAMPTPAGCLQSTTANRPYSNFPTGEIMCVSTTGYDGVGNAVSDLDGTEYGTSEASVALYDAVHHPIVSIAPRYDATFTNLVTVTLYDQDGHVTDVCPPRELAEGSADGFVCNATSTFGTHTTYDVAGRVLTTAVDQTAGGTPEKTTYGYDGDGNRTSVKNADLFSTTYSYSVLDRKTAMSVPRTGSISYQTTYTYDPSGDLVEEDQPVDGTQLIRTEYVYDADHQVIDSIQGASASNSAAPYVGNTGTDVRTRNVYDPDGNVIEQYQPNAFTLAGSVANPDPDYATGAKYNADDERIDVYTPRYDSGSHSPTLSDPTSNATQSAECPSGGVTGLGYPSTLGICTTAYAYDADGNIAQVTWPTNTSGAVTTYTYTNTNQILTQTNPNPDTAVGGTVAAETYAYDAEGKQTDETDANGIYTQTAYTADELVATTTNTPNGGSSGITHVTSYLYDGNGEQTQVIDAVGNATKTSYDAAGLTASVTDGAGDETTYVYDAVGNPTEVISPDANANAAANPGGLPTYNYYTADNLLQASVIPYQASPGHSQRAVCYAYDQSGRKSGQGNWVNLGAAINTEPASCVSGLPSSSFKFTTAPDGRLQVELGRDGSSTLSYSYDADGNQLQSAETGGATTTDTYYADNSLRTAQDMTTNYRTTNYAYDGAGNVTARNSVPSGSGYTYTDTITYNAADLQAAETSNLSAGTTAWSYDAGGRLTELDDGGGDYTQYAYASDGTLDGEAAYDAGGIYGSFFSQTLDGDYHVTSDGCTYCSTATGGEISHTFTYQYDAAGRLIFINATGGSAAFQTYDQDGNRITHDDVTTGAYTNYTYNADNSIATTIRSGTPATATYDIYGAGVMTSDGCANWELDTFDRATSYAPVASPPLGCPTVSSASYTFDANGTVVTSTSGGTTTTIHDDPMTSTPIVENVGSTPTAYVLDGNGTPLEAAQGSTAAYLVDDPKGDLSTVMEPATIIYPTCQLQYDPYGTAVFTTSAANLCETGSTFVDLLYQNGRRDSSSGTYQLGSRTYDPSKNSFLSPDHYQLGTPAQDLSIGIDPLTENAYTFVDGDPVNQFDPTGHMFTTGTEGTGGDQTCSVCYTYATAETGKTRAQATATRNADVRHDDKANAAYKAAEQRKAAAAAATAASAARPGFQDASQSANYVPGEGDCEYTSSGQVVCPDYAGNYDLTSDQYDACPGCAPGDAQPQRTTAGDLVFALSIVIAVPNLWDGGGEAIIGADVALDGADAGASAVTEEGSSALDDAIAACVRNSFSAATLVVMANGSVEPISQVKVGDKVESTDPATGKTVSATVSHLFVNDDHKLADVTVRNATGAVATLETTQGHRFWDVTRGAWIFAGHFTTGDTLLSDDNQRVVVVSVHDWTGSQAMFDLTVDAVHTFYVRAGADPVLVHNCAEDPDLLQQAQEQFPNKANQIEGHHVVPQYLGGPVDGPIVDIDASYHQLLTNAFRQAWAYGQGQPSLDQLREILTFVYGQIPLNLGG